MRALLAAMIFCALIFTGNAEAQTLVSETIGVSPTSRGASVRVSRGERPSVSRVRVVVRGKTVWRTVRVASVRREPVRGIAVMANPSMGFSGGLIAQARAEFGLTGEQLRVRHARLWCAERLNVWLERLGYRGTGSAMAGSFLNYGRPAPGPQVGAIAVIGRGRYARHVGIVTGIDGRGDPVILSANHNNRVGEGAYPRHTIIAYRSI